MSTHHQILPDLIYSASEESMNEFVLATQVQKVTSHNSSGRMNGFDKLWPVQSGFSSVVCSSPTAQQRSISTPIHRKLPKSHGWWWSRTSFRQCLLVRLVNHCLCSEAGVHPSAWMSTGILVRAWGLWQKALGLSVFNWYLERALPDFTTAMHRHGDGISVREASWLSSFEVYYPTAILRNNSVQDTQQGSPLSLYLPPSNAGI